MRLAEFIRANIEKISCAWEEFARSLLPEQEFDRSVLRNSIKELLEKIAADMDKPQSGEHQQQKSEGHRQSQDITDVTERHVVDRIAMGLSSRQLISEYRALRASVIRLWQEDKDVAYKEDLYDLTRFNEAVDETLIEAEVRYTRKLDESRELFLGILAHDLRNPLWAISGAANLILQAPDAAHTSALAHQILGSVSNMTHIITDLVELTRIKLGRGIAIQPSAMNMRELCLKAVGEIQSAYPDRVFRLEAGDDLVGEWDEPKLNQVLSNLLGNAVQHGSENSEIAVTARKTRDGVELTVHNEGPAIPKNLLPRLFDRFVQEQPRANVARKAGSMGLGLYIAKEIIITHGGTINVESSEEDGTTFFVCLPRSAQPSDAETRE